jgi:alkaline phosphatase D
MAVSGSWDAPISRRQFVGLGGASAAMVVFGGASSLLPRARGATRFHSDPFSLGVASGDPTPDGVLLWTRLAPDPLHGGGMPARAVPVRWEVAGDERFRKVVAHGEQAARPELAHSLHVEVGGLRPGREYFYRFLVGSEASPVGRTKTAPTASALSPVRFAFASCQHYEHGFYTAYGHLAREDVDLVLHLGDYIYEFGPGEYRAPSGVARSYSAPEPTDLAGYRNRHAEHRSDDDLQEAHRVAPWVVTWDDHEVKDNYAGGHCAGVDPDVFHRRRQAAYQAYYEHMPLRPGAAPGPRGMRLYRRLDYGRLVRFNVLDTRQHRDTQAAIGSGAWDSRRRTLTGTAQERWLFRGLERSPARWNVLAQQIFFARRDADPGPRKHLMSDAWDGYPAARDRVSAALAAPATSNPVVLSGDVHSSWANDLLADYDDPRSKVIGTEFVGTSISSGGDGADADDGSASILRENPHIKFFDGRRGYVRCHVTEGEWRTDYRVVPYVSRRGAPVSTRASFVVHDGSPGLEAPA